MSHRPAELRSKALHELVAQRIEREPHVVARALERVERWMAEGGPVDAGWATRWHELLSGPRDVLLATLRSDDQEAVDLRQNTPFAGVVPERTRQQLIREIGRHAS